MLFSMLKQKLCLRADFTTLSMMKKLSKRTADKQAAEQSVNDQLSVQTLISSKMSKKLAQFFTDESDKTSSGTFKIKLEALTFESESESLSKESD